jgi:hypothetical protein
VYLLEGGFMYRTSGSDALAIASKNPTRTWSGNKFNDNFFHIKNNHKCHLSKEDIISTMGYCFERKIETNLIKSKFNLATQGCGVPPEYFDSWNEVAGTGGGSGAGS